MTPVRLLLIGQALIFLDLRAATVDVLPDPVGWAMSGYALSLLLRQSRYFPWAMAAAVVAGVLSLVDWVWPLTTVDVRQAGVTMDDLFGAAFIHTTADTAMVVLTALGLAQMAARRAREDAARPLRQVAGAVLAARVAALGFAAVFLTGALPTMAATFSLLLLAAAKWAAYVWWLVLLYLHREDAWALPGGEHSSVRAEFSGGPVNGVPFAPHDRGARSSLEP